MDFKLQSDETKDIAQALSKAQSQIQNASKDSRNPHFNSDFASLAAIINATRDVLAANSLSVVQATVPMGQELMLVTTLAHSSGQWFRSYTPVLSTKKDAQGMGSGITYARRYALAAIVGITQEDDDGNSASQKPSPVEKSAAPAKQPLDPGDFKITFGRKYKDMTVKQVVERDGLAALQGFVNWLHGENRKKGREGHGSFEADSLAIAVGQYASSLARTKMPEGEDGPPDFGDDGWDTAYDAAKAAK